MRGANISQVLNIWLRLISIFFYMFEYNGQIPQKERISKDYSQTFAKKRNFRLLFNSLFARRVLGFKLSGICSRGALSSALIQPFHFDYLAFFQSSFSQRGYKNTFCRHSVPPSFFTALMRPREILSVPFAQFHKKSFLFFNRFPIEKSTGFKNHLTEKRKQTESPILCPCCGQSPYFVNWEQKVSPL